MGPFQVDATGGCHSPGPTPDPTGPQRAAPQNIAAYPLTGPGGTGLQDLTTRPFPENPRSS